MPDRHDYWPVGPSVAYVVLFMKCIAFPATLLAQGTSWLHLADAIHPEARLSVLGDSKFTFLNSRDLEIQTSSVVRWGRWMGVVGQQAVWLSDGSWLAGQILSVDDEYVSLQNRWLDLKAIPIKTVRALIYSPVASLPEWIDLIDQLEDLKGESDTVWLRDGSRLAGVVELSPIGDPAAPAFTLEVGQEQLAIPWARVATLATSPTLIGPLTSDRLATTLGLEDGSRLNVSRLMPRPERVELELLPLGQVFSLDRAEVFASAIRLIERDEVSQVQRCDTLQPTSFRFIPDSELIFTLGVNRSVFDRPLLVGHRLEAGLVSRGLAMHSSSQVAFRWDKSPGKFLAEACMAGLPDNQASLGDTACKVLIAKERELATAVEFVLSRNEQAMTRQQVDVDITGAQLVVLVVEKARFGQWGDEVYWLDARFFRR